MPDDIYIVNESPNTFGTVVFTGLSTYQATRSSDSPEPDTSGLNAVYNDRFLPSNGAENSMDRLLADDYYSATAATGVIGNLRTLDFDAVGSENAIFNTMSPSNYGKRALDVLIEWTIETTGTGNVVWGAQINPYTEESQITGDNYGTMISGAYAVPASGVVQESRIYMTYEAMQNLRRSELYSVKIVRQGTSSSDTYAADACLLSIELIESSSMG